MNPRHPAPKAGALPNCAIPRHCHIVMGDGGVSELMFMALAQARDLRQKPLVARSIGRDPSDQLEGETSQETEVVPTKALESILIKPMTGIF